MRQENVYFLESSFKEEIQPKPNKYQIEIKEDSFGCTINFLNEDFDNVYLKMEIVRKNKSNIVLIDNIKLPELINLVSLLTKKGTFVKSIYLPFSIISQNLELNKENYLLITIESQGNEYLSHQLLKTRGYTPHPFTIESKKFDTIEFEIDSKDFNYLYCDNIKYLQSTFTHKALDNRFSQRKTYYDKFYINNYFNNLLSAVYNEVFYIESLSVETVVYLLK